MLGTVVKGHFGKGNGSILAFADALPLRLNALCPSYVEKKVLLGYLMAFSIVLKCKSFSWEKKAQRGKRSVRPQTIPPDITSRVFTP